MGKGCKVLGPLDPRRARRVGAGRKALAVANSTAKTLNPRKGGKFRHLMPLKAPFLTQANFELAYRRIVRAQNRDYKEHYRHLLPSYNLSLKQNIGDLINDLKTQAFKPSAPTLIFSPKGSGSLRPLKLLCLQDLIVYQAIINIIANRFWVEQKKYASKLAFGAIFAGKQSDFFFRSWKVSYSQYAARIEKAFRAKNTYVADFDLVSFYDLIDHHRLRACIEEKVKDTEFVDLLFQCLRVWTIDSDEHLGHGVPQGPEASAFLAECLLFGFDAVKYRDVVYARYVDDIRLMARDEVPVRRALLRLDLMSRKLGLVPQAQKILLRRVKTLKEIRKTLPSTVLSAVAKRPGHRKTQKGLLNAFRQSVARLNGRIAIGDITLFKYALLRLNPRKDILRRIRPLFISRPDCSYVLSRYAIKFPNNLEAANILLDALKRDPTYDQSAAQYIEAMDVCEPKSAFGPYRRVIRTVNSRSEERSILLPIASLTFLGKRYGPSAALKRINKQNSAMVRSSLIHRLFGDHPDAPFTVSDCSQFLQQEACSADRDAARFSAALLLQNWPGVNLPLRAVNRSVRLLLVGLGLRRRGPNKATALEVFFREQRKIFISISWKKALKKDWRETERRCIELQKLLVGNPSARLLMLDTFNEILTQNFSLSHPLLRGPYLKAAGKNPQPDFGGWLLQPFISKVLLTAAPWFKTIHDARVGNELAHAKVKKGRQGGKPTKPIGFAEIERLMRPASAAWADLIREWKKIL